MSTPDTAQRIATEAAEKLVGPFLCDLENDCYQDCLENWNDKVSEYSDIILTAAEAILAERILEWGIKETLKELHDLMQAAKDDDPSGYHRLGFDSFTLQPARAALSHLDQFNIKKQP